MDGWHQVQSCDVHFDSPLSFCSVGSKKDKNQANGGNTPYITRFHTRKHKPGLSWRDLRSLSRCFTPHPLRGLFVSCFRAWQLWHGFLPSWPCSLKCNKSWIPRLCCTLIHVLVVADKWSPTPPGEGKNKQTAKTAVQSCSAEVKYKHVKPTAPSVMS